LNVEEAEEHEADNSTVNVSLNVNEAEARIHSSASSIAGTACE